MAGYEFMIVRFARNGTSFHNSNSTMSTSIFRVWTSADLNKVAAGFRFCPFHPLSADIGLWQNPPASCGLKSRHFITGRGTKVALAHPSVVT
jgi:hypothetical protein